VELNTIISKRILSKVIKEKIISIYEAISSLKPGISIK
jgi:hypothetical protein